MPNPAREARLDEAITAVLPVLADVAVKLRQGARVATREELAEDVGEIATRLKVAQHEQNGVGGRRAYLTQRCRCGHPRAEHSPHVDPAEPCTHGEDTGDPCPCDAFRKAPA